MRFFHRLSAVAVFYVVVNVAPAQDLEAGKILSHRCSVCHGKQGISRDPEVPHLAGQPVIYLEKSLTDFIQGNRQDRRMDLIVKSLSKEDVKALAAWYALLSRTPDK